MEQNVSLLHYNIQGIRNKLPELEIYLTSNNLKPDIILISEHWLRQDNINLLRTFPNYKLSGYFAREQEDRGGSSILLRKNLNFTIREDIILYAEIINFEIACTEVSLTHKLEKNNIIILAIYRTPNSNTDILLDKLELILNKLHHETTKKQKKLIIAGDFNINVLENNSTKDKYELIQLMNSHNMVMNFNKPTRITKTSATCIDNIFTNFIIDSSQIIEPGLADHTAQIIKFTVPIVKSGKKIITHTRKFNKQNLGKFNNLLNTQDWSPVFMDPLHQIQDLETVNEAYNTFSSIFYPCFEMAFPKTSNTMCSNLNFGQNNWITKGIRKSCDTKKTLFIKMKKSNDETSKLEYKKYKKCLALVIKEAKKLSNNKYIDNHNNKAKAAWAVINKEIGRTGCKMGIDKINLNGQMITDPKNIASNFNIFFNTIADKLHNPNNLNNPINTVPLEISNVNHKNFETFNLTNEREIVSIVKSLRKSSAFGWDEISTNLLKQCISSISLPLTHIINQSLLQGIFPEKLKFGIIKPIFKKGDTKEMNNYRPIALLPTFSKILERVVYIRLVNYLETNNILNASQFGFRKGKNISQAIFDLIQTVTKALDSSTCVAGIYCDLSKAFDCVNHLRLLNKLISYGIQGNALQWFKSYLTARKQKVIINNTLNSQTESSWIESKHGVPQGSILGPILFLIYINDLPLPIVNSQVILFADDTTILSTAKNKDLLNEKLLNNITTVTQWLDANFLTLNVAKTQLLQFNCKHKSKEEKCMIKIPPINIEAVNSTKFLGITLDETLTWKYHIESLSKKLSKACFELKTLSGSVSHEILLTVYHALFSSHLVYGIIFWGNASNTISLFRLQKRAIRTLANIPYNSPCRPHFKTLGILPLPCLYIFNILIFQNLNPTLFNIDQHVHQHDTRNLESKVYQYPIHRTTLLENGPFYSALKLYNCLPKSIKESVNFKKSLKDFLLQHCFYNIDEFLKFKF